MNDEYQKKLEKNIKGLKSIEKETLDGTTEGALGSTVNFPMVNLTISSSSQISS